jgi:hypothetical protein
MDGALTDYLTGGLLGENESRIKVISNIIMESQSVKPWEFSEDIKNFFGQEAMLLMMLNYDNCPQSVIQNTIQSIDWEKLWNYLIAVQNVTLSNIIQSVLFHLSSYSIKNIPKLFTRKLINKAIDQNIEEIALQVQSINLNDIISKLNHTLSFLDISLREKYLSVSNINVRVNYLKRTKMLREVYRNPNFFRATSKLRLKLRPKQEGLYYSKTFNVLDESSIKLHIPLQILNRAKDIAAQVRLHMQGRESKAVAAGILYFLSKEPGFYASRDDIATVTNTNPATVTIMSQLITHIVHKS